ncbi:MerR family transcriptional regulator [Amycolatopsis keratiniphila]|uniref:MerR family transcriptional regulator n=1 Tax=Amycolatopsis keratiniphila TaxID=129921 RepID=UPI0018D289CB|nr:MerR family transcriptional regulator [Amycolatopsis keratiniphila]
MNDERTDGRHLLTIGRLADYAGVTIKAVRVYHDRGLLPEPPRDSSGYRRYGAEHAIQLVKIRTLAEAGVPLARIGELLAAGREQFTAAIDEIDRGLRERAEQIRRARHRLAQLHDGDRLFVSAEVADYLGQLREIGVSERTVLLERDLWIMMRSVAPGQAAAWIADKVAAVADPEFRSLYLDYDAAFGWSPDDPRLPAIAERTRQWFAAQESDTETGPPPDPTATRLAATTTTASSPAWARIAELARHRT